MWNEKKPSPPPSDRGQAVAVVVFVLGVETLLPWNFFITDSQYFNDRLRESNATAITKEYNFGNWMALLSQLPLLLFTLLNSFLYQRVTERLRVAFSLVFIFLLFSLTAVLVVIPMQPDTFFSVTMATIWFINMFSAVLQGSLFGVVGLLPPRYSTLFMSGQGLAGMFAAIARLCSILSEPDRKSAALGYFITPCVATLVTLFCYLLLPHLEFARFYLSRSQPANADASHDLLGSAGEKALNGKKKDLEPIDKISGDLDESQECSSVLAVFKKIWLMAACVTCVFAVTLSVFPVITAKVKTVYEEKADWDKVFSCVCCFVVFNVMDFIGRSAPSLIQWPSKDSRLLPAAVLSRVVFIPLFLMCNIPDSKLTPLLRPDWCFVITMALFSFSNGYLASLCMAYAPQLVRFRDCETAGSLMTSFLVLGLAVGASFSFLLRVLV
ncbi:equilibrative nucleoside transporter 2 isoform X2 [Nothobranchius furzeri]|nr:equilibrative nucleoside transporter 2 [Nothobranchius furzeri]XP_054607724.1 equilibrative nucleoside transporter 2 [Nothobranchius furzeri]